MCTSSSTTIRFASHRQGSLHMRKRRSATLAGALLPRTLAYAGGAGQAYVLDSASKMSWANSETPTPILLASSSAALRVGFVAQRRAEWHIRPERERATASRVQVPGATASRRSGGLGGVLVSAAEAAASVQRGAQMWSGGALERCSLTRLQAVQINGGELQLGGLGQLLQYIHLLCARTRATVGVSPLRSTPRRAVRCCRASAGQGSRPQRSQRHAQRKAKRGPALPN
jgi:hypothetical protein